MTSDRDAELTLQRALGFLMPELGDEARVLAGVQQRLADAAGLERLEPDPVGLAGGAQGGRAALRSGIAAKLCAVGAFTAVLGFAVGFAAGQRSSVNPAAAPATAVAVRLPSHSAATASLPPTSTPPSLAAERLEHTAPPLTHPANEALSAANQGASSKRGPGLHTNPPDRSNRRPTTAPVQSVDALDLQEALALLRRAQAAASESRPGAALELLSEIDRRASKEMLAEERLVTHILALCGLGDTRSAQRLASELRVRNPSSIYNGRVRQSCAAEQPSALGAPKDD